ncbi:MAG: UMP kinase [Candidatus Nealsonbacteria bacterium]|nr:UMP kinase [Candidatus Nealsonbacteria bacterium]
MKKRNPTIVISLGGSIIVPGEIQAEFIKNFRDFIFKFLKRGYRFIIVTGGGSIARNYIKAASEITKTSDEDKDWLGIHATKINAQLIKTVFKKVAYPTILSNPLKKINERKYRLFIASGWKPGWSTDYITVLLAKRFKADKIINASNIDYVYDKNPLTEKNARPIKKMGWNDYRKIIGSKWKPGMKAPIDPVAAKLASKLKMGIIVARGTNLKNLGNILTNKKFKGTMIT